MPAPRRLRAIAVIFGCALVMSAFAQSYPARPIKFVIQYSAGGVHDTLARILQPRLAELGGEATPLWWQWEQASAFRSSVRPISAGLVE